MKRAFTFLFLVTLTHLSYAQITLTKENTPHSAAYSDVRQVGNGGIALPEHGTAITYDYSTIVTVEVDTIPYIPATRAGFEGFTRFSYGSSNLGAVPIFSEYYTLLTDEGIARMGSYLLPQKINLATISGSVNDTLTFPGNSTIFNEPAYDIKFPATYGDSWQTEFVFQSDYSLLVGAFGLNNVPGHQEQFTIKKDSIVGSGTLILPSTTGEPISYEVLLKKEERISRDSIYLGGALAPPPLLNAFGLSQGNQGIINRYYFFAEGYERPIMVLYMSEDWKTVERSYHQQNEIVSGTKEYSYAHNVSAFPNPVYRSSTVQFETGVDEAYAALQVFDNTGKLIYQTATDQATAMEWKVPTDLSTGLYFYLLRDKTNNKLASGKIVVQ